MTDLLSIYAELSEMPDTSLERQMEAAEHEIDRRVEELAETRARHARMWEERQRRDWMRRRLRRATEAPPCR